MKCSGKCVDICRNTRGEGGDWMQLTLRNESRGANRRDTLVVLALNHQDLGWPASGSPVAKR